MAEKKSAAKSAAKTAAKSAVKAAVKTTVKAKAKSTAKTAAKAAAKETSQTIRLSAEEKKLIQNYRKCNEVMRTMISAAVEKVASTGAAKKDTGEDSSGKMDLSGLFSLIGKS